MKSPHQFIVNEREKTTIKNHFSKYDFLCAGYVLLVVAVFALLIPSVSATDILIYPNASSGGVDGVVYTNSAVNVTFTNMLTQSGTSAFTSRTSEAVQLQGSMLTNYYNFTKRVVLGIGTTQIPQGATITGATLYYRLSDVFSGEGVVKYALTNLSLITPNNLVSGDFNRANYSSVLLSPYATQNSYAYNSATLNSDGIAYLQSAVKNQRNANFSLRSYWDISGSFNGTWSPTNATSVSMSMTEDIASRVPFFNISYTYTGSPAIFIHPLNGNGSVINNTQYLTDSDTNLPPVGSTLSFRAFPDQFEWSSFILKPNQSVTGITITNTELTGPAGTIPASALDIKGLKVWYRRDNSQVTCMEVGNAGKYPTPQLLLKNLSLVRVDLSAHTNELWVKNSTYEGYVTIDKYGMPKLTGDTAIYDNATANGDMQPFPLATNLNQQIIVTTHVPAGQAAGTYSGKVWINSNEAAPVSLDIIVVVLPFTTVQTSIDFGDYYIATATEANTQDYIDFSTWSNKEKVAIITAELTNQKNHGILYPAIYLRGGGDLGTQGYRDMEVRFRLQNQSGLPQDKAFTVEGPLSDYLTGGDQNVLKSKTLALQNLSRSYGFTKLFEMGHDEPTSADITAERPSFQTLINNGTGTFFAVNSPNRAVSIASYTTVLITAGATNTTDMNLYRSANPSIKIYRYAYPQYGVAFPETYRNHNGLALLKDGYNGSFDFAYRSETYGNSYWNDFDYSGCYSMEGVTYPASNGPVDTIQWEGQREAVDDVKIADKLISVTNRTFTLSTIQAGFTAGQDMRQIRETMIDLILTAQPQAPIASFTANSTYGPTPLPVQFNDTSTNAPTSWTYGAKNQTPGNNSWFTLSSIKDPLVTFGVGNWSINLTAGNAYGANLSSSMWINVTEVSPTPTPTPTATPTTTATTAIPTTTTTTTVPTTAGNTTSKNPYDLPILGPGLFVVGLLVMFFGTCYLWMEKKGK